MSNLLKSGDSSSPSKFSVKGVDLTNPTQKLLALCGIVAGGIGLYYLMTFAITFLMTLGNFLLLLGGVAVLGIILIYLGMNWQNIWMGMKSLTWKTTKWMISKDNFGVMYRYLGWLDKQIVDIKNSIINISSSYNQLKDEVSKYQVQLKDKFDLLLKLEDRINQNDGNVTNTEKLQFNKLSNEVTIYKETIQSYIPMIEDAKIRLEFLEPLKEFMENDKEAFSTSIEMLEKQYNASKVLNKAIDSAEKFFSTGNTQYKLYSESRKQVEDKMFRYEARFKDFSKQFNPILANAELTTELRHDRVREMLDNYKQSQVSLSIDIKSNTNTQPILIESGSDTNTESVSLDGFPNQIQQIQQPELVEAKRTVDNSLMDILNYKP